MSRNANERGHRGKVISHMSHGGNAKGQKRREILYMSRKPNERGLGGEISCICPARLTRRDKREKISCVLFHGANGMGHRRREILYMSREGSVRGHPTKQKKRYP